MERRVLVSACLLGVCCRYDGGSCANEAVRREAAKRGWIPVCPEILGGLTTPRLPSERRGEKIVDSEGKDVTAAFVRGANEAVKVAELYGAELALLKERSPSCGSGVIYDGSFTGGLTEGHGMTAALFAERGIRVFGESDLDALINELKRGEEA